MHALVVAVLCCLTLINCNAAETKRKYTHSFDEETYDTIVLLVQGNFETPVAERTRVQRNAIVRYWRRKHDFSTGPEPSNILYFRGKPVLKRKEVAKLVENVFHNQKSAGYRKLWHLAADSLSGLTETAVRNELRTKEKYSIHSAKFTNKAIIRPVRAKCVQSHHQVDLVDFSKSAVRWKGKTYKFVLSLVDVFSRYIWLVALQTKKSKGVASALRVIYEEHGPPNKLQMDQGVEFKGHVNELCKTLKIKPIRSRPYHPQSQGKVERSHRQLKKKIMYDFVTMGAKGVNWASHLRRYASILNNEKKECLGWQSSFEVYFGRKSNTALDVDSDDFNADMMIENIHEPNAKDRLKQSKYVTRTRHRAEVATKKTDRLSIQRQRRLHPPSVYNVGDDVLCKYGSKKGKLAPKKQYVVKGRILARRLKSSMYKISFTNPITGKEDTPEWISVDRLSSTTIDEEVKRKQRASSRLQRRHHRAKYQIPLLDTDRPFALQGDIVYDPPGNGNCQFAALCHLLSKIGIFRSPRTLREQVVSYLLEHPYTSDGSPLELFVGEDWDTYISGMLEEGTYGDHITLQAVSDMFNVDIIVHSSLGGDATVNIVPTYSVATQTISLGHFAEEEGEHYVALQLHETQSEDQPRDGEGNRNLPRQVFDSANSGDEEHNLSRQHHSQCDDDEFLDMQGNINEGFNRTNSSDEEQGHSPSKDREPLDMQGDLNEGFYSTNSSDEEVFLSCRKDKMPQYDTQVAFTDLPNEVVLLIIEVSLQLAQQSSDRLLCKTVTSFLQVSHQFHQHTRSFLHLRPRIYCPHITISRTVSVRRIIMHYGKSSGVAIELKRIISHRKWINAWLLLEENAFEWYAIIDIFWKK